jgi:hypothetical protein
MDMTSDNKLRVIYNTPGVMTDPGNTPPVRAIKQINVTKNLSKLYATGVDGEVLEFAVTELTQSSSTDRIKFVSDDVRYSVRELRDTDGIWLSALKAEVPVDALEILVDQGDNNMNTEALLAYALDDSPYVVALVYTNAMGRWSRVDGTWVLLAADDSTFAGGNAISLPIEVSRAAEYIDLFDKNYVTVTDTENYESADTEEPTTPDDAQSDNQ